MINKIRKELALKYTLIILSMLIVVFISNYFVINHVIMESSIADVKNNLQEKTWEAAPAIKYANHNPDIQPQINIIPESKDIFYDFAYWIDIDGRIIMAEELASGISDPKRQIMRTWNYADKEAHPISITDEEGNIWNLIMASNNVFHDGKIIGKVFVGKDMTAMPMVKKKYLYIVSILIIITIVLSFILANQMADKAMVPIKNTFEQQNKFVADASHEMRTPLSVMLASIDMLEVKSKEARDLKDNIKTEILSMRELVSDLLELARFDNSTTKLEAKDFDLTQSADDVVRSMLPIAQDKNITLNFSPEKSAKIKADEKKIKQVMYIFIDNAIKYSPENSTIEVSVRDHKTAVKFVVKDQGPGIPKSEQSKIFTRFYRINKSRSRAIGGSGLGLAIASEIIQMHSGDINLTSNGKQGSTFFFNLKKQ